MSIKSELKQATDKLTLTVLIEKERRRQKMYIEMISESIRACEFERAKLIKEKLLRTI